MLTTVLGFIVLTLVTVAVAAPALAESGIASHYSTRDSDQTGSRVACPGRKLVDSAMVAAHKSLPCGTKVTVTNKRNGRSVQVTIIDRGPYRAGRIVDVSLGAARALGFQGLTPVTLEVLGK